MHFSTHFRSGLQLIRVTQFSRPPPPRVSHSCLFSSSIPEASDVVVDQTKKNNRPGEDQTDQHKKDSKEPDKGDARYHEGIDADQEEPTDASTGIKTEGQGTPAGQGERKSVRTETREKPGPNMTWGGDK